jgi:transcriptional regulator with XRE-family HTH domain
VPISVDRYPDDPEGAQEVRMILDRKAPTMNPLQRIIEERRAELRLSYGDIAKRGGLSKSRVHQLATREDWVTSPHPELLDRLALGLNLPATVVRAAAAEAAGLTKSVTEVDTDTGLRILIGSIERLTEEQRQQVAALVNAMTQNSGS